MKTVNEIKNSYAHYLVPKIRQIYGMSVLRKVSIEAMRKNIYNYIYDAPAYYTDESGNRLPTKKVEFLKNIDNMDTKKEIYRYCLNSVNKARKTLAHCQSARI